MVQMGPCEAGTDWTYYTAPQITDTSKINIICSLFIVSYFRLGIHNFVPVLLQRKVFWESDVLRPCVHVTWFYLNVQCKVF